MIEFIDSLWPGVLVLALLAGTFKAEWGIGALGGHAFVAWIGWL
jgi:hypothetical protein